MNFINETKKTPVRLSCDVLVVGGGTTGVVAALAAARNGADTVLIDRFGFLGGTIMNGAGPLHSYFNLFKAFPDAEKLQVVRGIPDEIIARMVERGDCYGHLEQEVGYAYDSIATIVQWEPFKGLMFEMMEEAGVKLLLHTLAVDAIMDGNNIKGVIIESKSSREAILAKVVIDCTGDGDVAFYAGEGFDNMFSDSAVGMPFGMCNVDINRLKSYVKENDMMTQIVHADKEDDTDDVVRLGFNLHKLPVFKEYMEKEGLWGPLTVSHHVRDMSYINTANLRAVDALNVEEESKAEITLRNQVMTMSKMLKEHIPGFENASLYWTPVHFGVRRTRIIDCEFDISIEHIVDGVKTDDEIARYGFHDMAPRIMIKNADCYSIPYRAVLPKTIEQLLVAGRMITKGFEAHMSTRNTVSCMAQGQGVGTAAALCISEGVSPRVLDRRLLRQTLIKQDVYLG